MNKGTKIKVIKKGDKSAAETPPVEENQPEEEDSAKQSSTVSGWIDEFQNRRRRERESAIKQFNS